MPDRLLKPSELKAGLEWYSDVSADLYIWRGNRGEITRFQFTYNKGTGREEVVEWKGGRLLGHALVDSGDDLPGPDQTPVIVANGVWDRDFVAGKFAVAAKGVEKGVFEFVLGRLRGRIRKRV